MEYTNTIWPEWKIVGKIGQGTYGTVYKIEKHDMLGTEQAALKIISLPKSEDDLYMLRHSGMDEQTVSRTLEKQVTSILQEYKLMRALRDVPGVVHCDNYGYVAHPDGMGWDIHIQMELLTPFLRQKELIREEADIVRFGIELCRTLESCHAHGIIHRDIKPHNIFVTDDGRYKLGDFGIARFSDGTATATMGAGTLSFMAPEVLAGKRYNHTVDLYSLGMVMYWLLNDSKGPFLHSGRTQEEASAKRFGGEPLPAPKNGSAGLKQLVLKACAFEPEARFATASQMRAALEQLEPVHSIPLHVPDRTIPSEDTDKTLGIFPSDQRQPQEPTVRPVPTAEPAPVPVPASESAASVRPSQTPPVNPRKKNLLPAVVGVVLLIAAAAWFLIHNWTDATCTVPQTCKLCGKTSGEPLGHDWSEADCDNARTCARCGETEGEALGHDWQDATKDAPMICSRCAATEGDTLPPHVLGAFTTATYGTGIITGWNCDYESNSYSVTLADADYAARAANRLSVKDYDNRDVDPAWYHVEAQDNTIHFRILDGAASGTYHIKTDYYETALVYGWHGDFYYTDCIRSSDDCILQSYTNKRYLSAIAVNDVSKIVTVPDREDATLFDNVIYTGQVVQRENGPELLTAKGFTFSDGSWYTHNYADTLRNYLCRMYLRDDVFIDVRAYQLDGYFLASDEEGNIFLSAELTEECCWIVLEGY